MRAVDQSVILRPVITEKSTRQREKQNKVTFEVKQDAEKHAIKRAVERMFEVKVEKVNVQHRPGKMRRVRFREGLTRETKRAVVTLAAGSKIEFFEGI